MGNVYLAGRYSRRLELCRYRMDLQDRGHQVPARWLNGDHQAEDLPADRANSVTTPSAQATEFALDDLEDIVQCDALVAFTEEPRTSQTRGGRHWELGFGCGVRYARWPLSFEPAIFLVGPLEHVFTALPLREQAQGDPSGLIDGRFATWPLFLSALDHGRITL